MSESIGTAGAASYRVKDASFTAAAAAARWRLAAAGFVVLMVAAAVYGGVRWFSAVPLGDAWDGIVVFRIFQAAGEHSVWWAQHNEHRIVLARLLFWLDFELFGGRAIFLIVANYALVAATVLLFAGLVRAAHRAPSLPSAGRGLAETLWTCFLAAWLFQWMQFENLTRPFQSQFFLATLVPLAALYFLYRAVADARGGRRDFAIACMLGVASVGTMANGVLALPLMVVYAALTRQARTRIVLLALLAALTLAAYFHGYVAVSGHGSLGRALREQPLDLLHYWLLYIGGPFQRLIEHNVAARPVALVMGCVFVLASAAAALRALRRRADSALPLALLAFIAYFLATALATAGGRVNFGIDQALTSRYTTPALMAWGCLLLLHAVPIERVFARRPRPSGAAAALLALLMLNAQAEALQPRDWEMFEMDVGALALGLHVRDAQQVRTIYPVIDPALRIADAAVEREVAIYDHFPFHRLKQQIGRREPTAAATCRGHVETTDRIDGDEQWVRVGGWIFDPASRSVPRQARFIDTQGQVIGLALAGGPFRADLARQVDPHAGHATFRGYVRADRLAQAVTLQDSEGRCRLPLQIQWPYVRTTAAATPLSATALTVGTSRLRPGGTWPGTDSQHSALPGLRIIGSYHRGGDADTGAVELKARRGDRLLYRSGPTGGRQRLELPGSGLRGVVLPVALDWQVLALDGAELPDGEFVLRLVDDGSGWGEWSAIGLMNE